MWQADIGKNFVVYFRAPYTRGTLINFQKFHHPLGPYLDPPFISFWEIFQYTARIFQGLVRVSNHFLLKKQKKYQEDFIVLSLWGNISLLFLEKVVMIVNFHT